jgi:hypothetical protein
MTQFKKGDKVKCVKHPKEFNNEASYLPPMEECIGKEYTVTNVGETFITIDWGYNSSWYFPKSAFEKIASLETLERPYMTATALHLLDQMKAYAWPENYAGQWTLLNNNENKKSIMTNIISFAKNLTLSKEEKLLRKHDLKDSCGDYTAQAERLVIQKLIKDNESYLVELAEGLEKEVKENK